MLCLHTVQMENGSWRSARVIEQDVISNSKEYQSILSEAIGRMMMASPLDISVNFIKRGKSFSLVETSSSDADEEETCRHRQLLQSERQQQPTTEVFEQFKANTQLQIDQLKNKIDELEYENKCLREQLDQQVAMALEAVQAANKRAQDIREELERLQAQVS